jgi:serine phosphatase RsbU (regulator of sigma subunit)
LAPGADVHAIYPVVTQQLQRDDLVLFYTDGLVERRASNTGELLERVKQTRSTLSEEADEHALTRLRRLLHSPSPDDDTCTLAVRVLPR